MSTLLIVEAEYGAVEGRCALRRGLSFIIVLIGVLNYNNTVITDMRVRVADLFRDTVPAAPFCGRHPDGLPPAQRPRS
ncbi:MULTISPECIES: hypothetical protein [Paenibacillus]|uniref:hypothetical protein n=1 Tax=Paenibacillus TaxID=44249 RepID=UPI002FE21A9E